MKAGRRARTGRMIAVAVTLAATGAATVYFVSSGGKGEASAETSLAQFVPIARVAPNVVTPKPRRGASTGTFTVDCGTNRNGKFSPDNPVAQPGIRNGAEHVHDFVGNQAITAATSDEALAAAGTSCRNGDRSSYFWPVVRIDKAVRAGNDLASAVPVVSCPSVRDRLPAVPDAARTGVDRQLAALDRSLAAANERIGARRGGIDAAFNNSVIEALRAQRATALRKISNALTRAGHRPAGLVSLVECEVSYDGLHAGHANATRSVANPATRCPSVRDKLPAVPDQAVDEVNRDLADLDRQIARADERLIQSPGDSGVAGTLRAERAATIDRIVVAIGRHAPRPAGLDALAACTIGKGQAGPAPTPGPGTAPLPDPSGPNLELPGNTGGIVRPAAVLIEYRGNPTGKVGPMPRFLRALTGDAKPTSRGPANARATWTCAGFTDRLSDKYPICPPGRAVMRVQDFPGCWNGTDIDSDNHRAHLAFADPATGACPAGFAAIPQLRISISYRIPRDVQEKGQYALDSFPEENHNPFSDHNDFINVNSDRQMKKITACLNSGRRC